MAILATWKLGSGLACSQINVEKPVRYSKSWVGVRKFCHQIFSVTSSSRGKFSLKVNFFWNGLKKYDFCILLIFHLIRATGTLRIWFFLFLAVQNLQFWKFINKTNYHNSRTISPFDFKFGTHVQCWKGVKSRPYIEDVSVC